jgi:formylglycine-generating enzyme required for sulfatase activity
MTRASFQAARRGAAALLRAARVSLCLGLAALTALPSGAGAADAATPALLEIPAGPFIVGSDVAERELAYRLDEGAYGHSVTREQRWYAHEAKRATIVLPAFAITRTAITNREYAAFVADTDHRAPGVDAATWAGYGLVHPFARTRRHAWRDGRPPAGRDAHPVVLVSHDDALAYAGWLSRRSGQRWRLPSEEEWEKAARGSDGRIFPWGDVYDAERLNSHDHGPFDTLPVGTFPNGASPFGILDGAGQVFEWTATPAGDGRAIVKGGSWDDKGCGVCRPAARHSRPLALKHIVIGFRLVRE